MLAGEIERDESGTDILWHVFGRLPSLCPSFDHRNAPSPHTKGHTHSLTHALTPTRIRNGIPDELSSSAEPLVNFSSSRSQMHVRTRTPSACAHTHTHTHAHTHICTPAVRRFGLLSPKHPRHTHLKHEVRLRSFICRVISQRACR